MAVRTMAARVVAAETLDGLPESDPAAQRSRRDLRRIHRAMGTRSIVRRALQELIGPIDDSTLASRRSLRVLELGAGDGTLMLGVAQALEPGWPSVELTLLDRQALVAPATIEGYAACGWTVTPWVVDVLTWATPGVEEASSRGRSVAGTSNASARSASASVRWDLIVANLFLHHFEGVQLVALLAAIEARTRCFLACEPRRAPLALFASHLVGALGANAVTREDAVLSVHAGFRGTELSALWPRHARQWRLDEHAAGLFSHCLRAKLLDAGDVAEGTR